MSGIRLKLNDVEVSMEGDTNTTFDLVCERATAILQWMIEERIKLVNEVGNEGDDSDSGDAPPKENKEITLPSQIKPNILMGYF